MQETMPCFSFVTVSNKCFRGNPSIKYRYLRTDFFYSYGRVGIFQYDSDYNFKR